MAGLLHHAVRRFGGTGELVKLWLIAFACAFVGILIGATMCSPRELPAEPHLAPITVDTQLALIAGRESAVDAARDLGYNDVLGVTCGLKRGDATARCLIRAREPAQVEGETMTVTLNLACSTSGCWQLESP